MGGADRHDDIAIDLGSRLVHGYHAIGVTVVGDPQIHAVRAHHLRERTQIGRAASVVDVHAVPLTVERYDRRAELPQDRGGGHGRRAMAAVHRDSHPAQITLDTVDGVVHVARKPVGERADATHSCAGGTLPVSPGDRELFYLVLKLVRKLEAFPAEQLDAVVGGRIV